MGARACQPAALREPGLHCHRSWAVPPPLDLGGRRPLALLGGILLPLSVVVVLLIAVFLVWWFAEQR